MSKKTIRGIPVKKAPPLCSDMYLKGGGLSYTGFWPARNWPKSTILEGFFIVLAPQAKILGACGAPNVRKHHFYTISALKTDEKPQNFPPAAGIWKNPV